MVTDRDIFRFAPDGAPKFGFDIPGVPWYIGSSSAMDYAEIGWQKIVVDEARNRFFVLFTGNHYPGGVGGYGFFLAGHDLASGQKLATWGGNVRAVGTSSELLAGIDIDGNGDVWTIVQVGTQFHVKKWRGDTGLNISPSNLVPPEDYTLIASPPGHPRRFQALGVRKTDNKIYIAFEESPYDTVVSLWDSGLQFLGRFNYSKEVSAPASLPPPDCCGTGLIADHPYLSDGFVDQQGALILGGTYRFPRWDFETEAYYVFPVVLKFGIDAAGASVQALTEFYEDQHSTRVAIYWAPERLTVRTVGTAVGDTYVQLVDLPSVVYLVSSAPAFRAHVWLPVPFAGSMGPPGCRYLSLPAITALSHRGNRLVVGGTVRKIGNPCGGEDPSAFTISYMRTFSFKCCVIRPFDWHFHRYEWFWHRWDGPWPPTPPDPCPRCVDPEKRKRWSSTGRRNERFIRDVGLLTATRPTMELSAPMLQRLTEVFAGLPAGKHFSESRQRAVVSQLERAMKGGGQVSAELRSAALEAANAVLLDQIAVRDAAPVKVPSGKQTARLGRVTVRMEVTSPGSLDLESRSGLPALPEGLDPLIPLGTFRLRFDGKLGAPVEVTFNLEDFALPPQAAALHVLLWDGKTYRDVTSAFNTERRIVSATTELPGDFVFVVSYGGKERPSSQFVK